MKKHYAHPVGSGLIGAIIPAVLAQSTKAKPSADVEAKITKGIKAVYPAAVIGTWTRKRKTGFLSTGLS